MMKFLPNNTENHMNIIQNIKKYHAYMWEKRKKFSKNKMWVKYKVIILEQMLYIPIKSRKKLTKKK